MNSNPQYDIYSSIAQCHRQLYTNQLSGSIPMRIGELTNLQYLCVDFYINFSSKDNLTKYPTN